MAGIGNIYRSEILWRQAIHPETPGRLIDQPLLNGSGKTQNLARNRCKEKRYRYCG